MWKSPETAYSIGPANGLGRSERDSLTAFRIGLVPRDCNTKLATRVKQASQSSSIIEKPGSRVSPSLLFPVDDEIAEIDFL
jgi:hypothetical protein